MNKPKNITEIERNLKEALGGVCFQGELDFIREQFKALLDSMPLSEKVSHFCDENVSYNIHVEELRKWRETIIK